MAYSDLSAEDLILLAAEFVGRGQDIPQSIIRELDPELLWEIQNPESTQHGNQEC